MRIAPAALLTALFATAAHAEDPIKVFILAGQSNMEGKAPVAVLDHQINAEDTKEMFAHLHKDGEYIVRDDVFIDYLGRRGGLTVGYGSRDRIGVELEFGNTMGDHFDEPVLLVKTAWGGKSIARDFRPPSAGLPDAETLNGIVDKHNEGVRKHNEKNPDRQRQEITLDEVTNSFGHFYREMMSHVHGALSEMGDRFPDLAGRDFEIAGFVWFQGWNDQYNGYELEYEANMAHMIRDVRKAFGDEDLPVVIGVMGQNGSKEAKGAMLAIQHAQMAMEEQFDHVTAVRTDELICKAAEELYPEWKERRDEWDTIGGDHPYHYLGSPVWFSRMGDAFGEAMLELMGEE